MRLDEWLRQAEARLRTAGIEGARMEAQVLAAHVLLADRSSILAHPEWEISELAAEHVLQRRESREPLAYILGWREFYGRRFRVTPDVLIPRQETETLVDQALAEQGQTLLDMGTGSGCIGITIALERPSLSVTATDVSERALGVASHNATDLGAEVEIVSSDGFSSLSGRTFDLIVSNPPYIAESEPLMPEVGRHEPAVALYAGPTGLEFYTLIADRARPHLAAGGRLLLELGHTQAKEVQGLFQDRGWTHVRTAPDFGGADRVIVLR